MLTNEVKNLIRKLSVLVVLVIGLSVLPIRSQAFGLCCDNCLSTYHTDVSRCPSGPVGEPCRVYALEQYELCSSDCFLFGDTCPLIP